VDVVWVAGCGCGCGCYTYKINTTEKPELKSIEFGQTILPKHEREGVPEAGDHLECVCALVYMCVQRGCVSFCFRTSMWESCVLRVWVCIWVPLQVRSRLVASCTVTAVGPAQAASVVVVGLRTQNSR